MNDESNFSPRGRDRGRPGGKASPWDDLPANHNMETNKFCPEEKLRLPLINFEPVTEYADVQL